jgi:ribosomal protein L13
VVVRDTHRTIDQGRVSTTIEKHLRNIIVATFAGNNQCGLAGFVLSVDQIVLGNRVEQKVDKVSVAFASSNNGKSIALNNTM